MATGRDVLKLIVDADSAGAVKEFDKLGRGIKSSIGDADKEISGFKGKLSSAFDGLQAKSPMVSGIFDKMGVSSQQAASMIATAIPAAAVAAGVGVAAFAVKSVGDFQKVALAADKFRDASGLSLDAASRWIAVADDVGIGASTMQSAFVKMEKAIDTNRAAFGDLVATTASGATDLNATFLNVIDHLQGIEDPIQRANEASKLFGRGFAEVAEILGTDADTLREKFANVAKEQIVNEEGVTKARDLESALDALGETVGDVGLKLGAMLAGPVAGLVKIAATGIDIAISITDPTDGKFDFLAPLLNIAENAVVPIGTIKTMLGALGGEADKTKGKVDDLAGAADTAKGPFTGMATAGMSAAESQRRLNESFGDFEGRAAGLGTAMEDYATATAEADQATKDLTNSILGLVDGEHAIRAAQQDVIEATERANEVNADGTATMLEKQIADDRAVQSALKLADANRVQAEATGDADAGQEAFIATLQHLSGSASPAVQTQLAGVVNKLQDVGNQHPNPTLSVNDQATAKIENARATLQRFGGLSATAAVNITADTGAADRALQSFLSRVRNSSGMVIIGGLTRQSGGPIPGGKNQPVPVMAHGGEYVLSADVVDRIQKGAPSKGAQAAGVMPTFAASGGGSSRTMNITINAGVGDPVAIGRAVKQAVAAAERAGVN